ncbi:hypothetical protein [Rugosimonospora africana]|uniref:Uncharacterized protein n=1 Tax=Rugosimonospora africana TaxID=556532 RepID=A0A8J3QZZ7_9ACTN|nr:hypothetical protein [Rugosimonospora africana]GIH19157.1 hypothetical protein Raf01_73290 [Rugosimonospora africana]
MPIYLPNPESVDEEGVDPHVPLAGSDGDADADRAGTDGAGATTGDEYEPL